MSQFPIVKLKNDDVKRIIGCLYEVQSSMQQPDFFYPSIESEVSEALISCEFSLGVEVNNKLIALSLLRYDPYEDCYYFEDVCVLEPYRGNHLQFILWNYQLHLIQYAPSICTIHPLNYASLKTAMILNMFIVDFKICYGSFPRYICKYDKNLRKEIIQDIITIENQNAIKSYISAGFYVGLYKVIDKTYLLAVYST